MNGPGADRRLAIAAAIIGSAPFLLAPFCGLYLDDYSFLRTLEGISPAGLWLEFLYYVPGRNLHIPFFYGLIKLTGHSVPAMHMVSLAFDALNAALLFLLIRRLTGLRSVALAGAAAFAVAPNHGETHYWITLIPQCQIPTALTLTAFLVAARGGMIAACAVYAVALFTYDQVFFLWPLLLTAAWSRDPAPRRGRYSAAAAALLTLNIAHIALRYLAPYANGGRPLIRFSDFFDRCRDAIFAVGKGLLPWPTSSHAHWAWSLPLIIFSLAAACWLVRTTRAQAQNEAAVLSAWTNGRGWMAAAAGGAAWAILSYFPNLFWYLSPRHSLLPSIGWALTLASVGAYAASRNRRTAAVMPWLAGVFFTAAVVSNVHEGTQWVVSEHLKKGFSAAVRLLPAPVEHVFLVGAPRYLRRAPAFNLPHDVAMSAQRARGNDPPIKGDYQLSPTLRGAVYLNDLTLSPPEGFRWIAAGDVNLISFDAVKDSFDCVAALDVQRPDGKTIRLDLRARTGCTLVLPMAAEAFMTGSSPGPTAPPPAGAPRAGGLTFLDASAIVHGDATTLEFKWLVEAAPKATLAFIPRIKGASGETVLDSVFPLRGSKRPYPRLWPLIDDLAPGLQLKRGQTLRQTFMVRRGFSAGASASLELDVFEMAENGSAVPLGKVTAPIRLTR